MKRALCPECSTPMRRSVTHEGWRCSDHGLWLDSFAGIDISDKYEFTET